MSMETKMAGSIDAVKKMIDSLMEKARSVQEKEIASLQEFAQSRGFDGKLEMWDVPYWRRKHRTDLYKYEEGEIREYFPFPRVLQGLLSLVEDLFGLKFQQLSSSEHPTWNTDVLLYALMDSNGTVVGHLYVDPYARPGQKILSRDVSSWMIGVRSRSSIVGHTPTAAVVLNFTPPLHGIPSLLSLNEVRTLFFKVGHALQHLLTESPYSEVAGLTNLEWDTVEVSAEFLKCWLTDLSTIKRISSHFEHGGPLPDHLFEEFNKASNHMAATDLCQQLYLSALDLELYSTKEFWLDVIRRLWPKFSPFPLDKTDSHPCWFTDIISGDWAAAYYSHVWSRMVATDYFSAFQEAGLHDREAVKKLGDRFRTVVLARGGGCHPSESFRLFRGRDPSPDALLAFIGLRKPVTKLN
nr:EOG090X02LQ [Cyclestheria hislopi]